MNICILGGGNIGTVLLGDLAARKKYTVNLFTRKPEIWSREMWDKYNESNIDFVFAKNMYIG